MATETTLVDADTAATTTTAHAYDSAGRLVSTTVAAGSADAATTTYDNGPLGRLEKITDPTGVVTQLCYDADGNQIRQVVGATPSPCGPTPPAGTEVSATAFDLLGRVSCEAGPDVAAAATYAASGELDCGSAGITRYSYDPAGRLESTTVAAGSADAATTTYDHGALGRLESLTDPTGVVTQLCYRPGGSEVRRVLGPAEDPCSPTPPGGGAQVWAIGYDTLGRVSCEAGPEAAASATYDASGELDCGSAGITRYSYDPAGRVTRVTRYADTDKESVTESSYDPAGSLSEVRVPPPGLDCYHWDTQSTCGANPEVIAPVTAEARTYTPTGRLETVTRPVPHRDEALRADFGDEPDIGVLETVTTRYSYDSAGRLESVADPYAYLGTQQPTTYSYDGAGRLNHEVTAAGIETWWHHDGAGRLRYEVTADPSGQGTWVAREHRYGPTGQLVSVTEPYPVTDPTAPSAAPGGTPQVAFAYDAAGRMRSVTDALTNTVTYAYDARGNRISRSSNGAGGAVTETWSYDPADRLVGTARQRADAAATMQTSVVYDFAYDTQTDPCGLGAAPEPLGRVIERIDDEDRRVCVDYDAAGRIGTEAYSGGAGTAFEVAYAYDEAGNPTTVTDTRQPGTWTRSFDLAGGVLAATMPDGTTRTYGRDSWGNLTSLAETRDGARHTNWRSYDLTGRLQYTGVATGTGDWLSLQIGRYERDPDGRPTAETLIELYWNEGVSIDWDDGTLTHTTGTVPPDDPDWFRYNYSGRYWDYDAAGEVSDYIEVLPEPTGSDPNSYTLDIGYLDRDPAGRITGDLEWVLDYDFDPYEMTIVDYGYTTYGYDHAGQLVSADDGETERAWDYDARGNRISEAVTDAGGTDTTTYGYDAWGRLASATAPGATTAYAYDDSGRRVSETAGSQVVSYGYDPAGDARDAHRRRGLGEDRGDHPHLPRGAGADRRRRGHRPRREPADHHRPPLPRRPGHGHVIGHLLRRWRRLAQPDVRRRQGAGGLGGPQRLLLRPPGLAPRLPRRRDDRHGRLLRRLGPGRRARTRRIGPGQLRLPGRGHDRRPGAPAQPRLRPHHRHLPHPRPVGWSRRDADGRQPLPLRRQRPPQQNRSVGVAAERLRSDSSEPGRVPGSFQPVRQLRWRADPLLGRGRRDRRQGPRGRWLRPLRRALHSGGEYRAWQLW